MVFSGRGGYGNRVRTKSLLEDTPPPSVPEPPPSSRAFIGRGGYGNFVKAPSPPLEPTSPLLSGVESNGLHNSHSKGPAYGSPNYYPVSPPIAPLSDPAANSMLLHPPERFTIGRGGSGNAVAPTSSRSTTSSTRSWWSWR